MSEDLNLPEKKFDYAEFAQAWIAESKGSLAMQLKTIDENTDWSFLELDLDDKHSIYITFDKANRICSFTLESNHLNGFAVQENCFDRGQAKALHQFLSEAFELEAKTELSPATQQLIDSFNKEQA